MPSIQKRLLYVDSSIDDCELVSYFLGDAGYSIETAQSVSSGSNLISSSRFDLYIFDLLFSDGSGFELISRAMNQDANVSILICSADPRDETKQSALEAGAKMYLTKPFDLNSLSTLVAQLISDR